MLTYRCQSQQSRWIGGLLLVVCVANQAWSQQARPAAQAGQYKTVPIQKPAQQPQAQPQAAQAQPAQQQQLPQPQPVQLTPDQQAQLQAAQQQQQAANAGVVNPVAPFPPLPKAWQDYLDQVLTKWEVESGKIEKFQCEFTRYQFDPALVERHPSSVAKGDLKYMKPDKGLFKVNQLDFFKTMDDKGAPKYEPNPAQRFGEYWICDGNYVHVLDQNAKKCIKHQLPPQMRGNAIHLSPLPFVFGVKKADLEARYWIKPLEQPKNEPNLIRLEIYPRRVDDASNYQRLQVVIDLRDWLPQALVVFLPNWRTEAQYREVYEFSNRVVNAKNILPAMFQKEFIPADPPKDWKVIVEPYQEEPAEPKVATPPTAMPNLK